MCVCMKGNSIGCTFDHFGGIPWRNATNYSLVAARLHIYLNWRWDRLSQKFRNTSFGLPCTCRCPNCKFWNQRNFTKTCDIFDIVSCFMLLLFVTIIIYWFSPELTYFSFIWSKHLKGRFEEAFPLVRTFGSLLESISPLISCHCWNQKEKTTLFWGQVAKVAKTLVWLNLKLWRAKP